MAPKKKEHSNDLRTLVIKHYLNRDSQIDSAIDYKEVQEYQVYWKSVWSRSQTEDNSKDGLVNSERIKI